MSESSRASPKLSAAESALYEEWKRYGNHLGEYASEFIGTAFLVFCVVAVVSFLFGDSSPAVHAMASARLRLFLAGLLIGASGSLAAISPPGKLSGAHLNPAVSFGFWLLGKMGRRDLLGYLFAQMAGGALGAFLGLAAFPTLAPQVRDAALSPGAGVSAGAAFLAEIVTTGLLCGVIFIFVSHKRLARWTPAINALICSLLVGLDGSYSGCGMNPARWFGPALTQGFWRLFWVYLIGPLCGAFLGSLAQRGLRRGPPGAGKLFHDAQYRSIFKRDSLPSRPPKRKKTKPTPEADSS